MKGEALVLDAALETLRISFSTRSGKVALRWLKNRALSFPEILLDGTVWDEDLVTLLYHAKKYRPVTPIWLLFPRNGIPETTLRQLGITGVKPHEAQPRDPRPMKSELVPLELRPEGEFLGVPVTDFLDVKTSPCDVYFKTPTEKFIAIIRKGEEGVAEKAFRYSQKGLSYLYIDRASHEAQLQRIVDFGKLLYSRDDLPAGMRTAHLIRQIGRRLENLNSMNQVDQRLWAETSKDLASIHSLWNAGPWSDPESVLWNASVLDHSSTVLVISLMLGRQLGFSTEANFVRLGLAAAFHDIGLLGAPTSLVGRMSQEGFDEARSVADLGIVAEEFLISHAERGAEWVDQKLGADTLVTQAIQLHHWRQDDRLSPHRNHQKRIMNIRT